MFKCWWIELELKYYTVAQQLLHGNIGIPMPSQTTGNKLSLMQTFHIISEDIGNLQKGMNVT